MTEQADLRALEIEAAKRVGYYVEEREITPGYMYKLMRPDTAPYASSYSRSAEQAWRWAPEYATDLNACWRDLVAWLTVRGYGVALDTDEHKTQAVVGLLPLYRDPPVYVTVRPPAHPAEAVLRAFLQAMEEAKT